MRRMILIFSLIGGLLAGSSAAAEKLTTEEALNMAKSINAENAYLLTALAERESSLRSWVTNGECLGLCQINPKWWPKEIEVLGITDLMDARQNMTLADKILTGMDYPLELKLMLYNMKRETAFGLWNEGVVSDYAKGIIKRSRELQEEDFLKEVNEAAVNTSHTDFITMNEKSFELCEILDCNVIIMNNLEDYEWHLYKMVR